MSQSFFLSLLHNTPQSKVVGELSYKIVLTHYLRADGRGRLYMQCFLRGKKKMLPLGLFVPPKIWDVDRQEVRGQTREAKDLNLIIGQKKAIANEIMVRYRLLGKPLSLEDFAEKFGNPAPEFDFLAYMDRAVEHRKAMLRPGTYRHHKATVAKLRSFRTVLLFGDFNARLIHDLKLWMMRVRKNNPNTIHSTFKIIKTYLNYASAMDGIAFDFDPKTIKLPSYASQRAYLTRDELAKLARYYDSEFCQGLQKQTLQVFLFACYTGLRYTDLATVTRSNIIAGRLVFVPTKTQGTGKIVTLMLPAPALRYLNAEGPLFERVPSNQVGNRHIKDAAKACGITKPVSWHVARHTFATLFLTLGGKLEVLQQLLGHAKITETQIYGKIIDLTKDEQMGLFDRL